MRSEKQHVPIDQYLDNLRSIVQHVRRIGANATVIITPPPVYEPDRLIDRQKKHGISDRSALAERTNQMTGAQRCCWKAWPGFSGHGRLQGSRCSCTWLE